MMMMNGVNWSDIYFLTHDEAKKTNQPLTHRCVISNVNLNLFREPKQLVMQTVYRDIRPLLCMHAFMYLCRMFKYKITR